MKKNIVIIPTYNEAENIELILSRISELNIRADILVIDDNSPDKTGLIAEKFAQAQPNVRVVHRKSKLGVGSAHLLGIEYGYKHSYHVAITMDADFSHDPRYLPKLLSDLTPKVNLVVGSRFILKDSINSWSPLRKAITTLAHFMTSHFLAIPYDASGGLRCYNLETIDPNCFKIIRSKDYSFFFESIYILSLNGYFIKEVPINLPKRVYGHSKMKLRHIFSSLFFLCSLSLKGKFQKDKLMTHSTDNRDTTAQWNSYWSKKNFSSIHYFYDIAATFYRNYLIKPTLNYFINKHFDKGSSLLHAGCGGGEVDTNIVSNYKVTALDISKLAINKYKNLHKPNLHNVMQGDILNTKFPNNYFDGVYNLGVMEHFKTNDMIKALQELQRITKPQGKIILFWPPTYGLSVNIIRCVHFFINKIIRKKIALHPPEPTKISSKRKLKSWLEASGLHLEELYFGFKDAFTYTVVVASKNNYCK